MAHFDRAASSMMRRGGCRRRRRGTRTPNGSVIAGPVVWPDGNPNSTGPGKSANRSRHHRARGRLARRLVAARQLADDDAPPRARADPLWRSCVHHAIEPVRPLADFVEEQHVARAADRTRTACRATRAAASACRRAAARAASPGGSLRAPAAPARPAARGGTARCTNDAAIVAGGAAASRPASIGP